MAKRRVIDRHLERDMFHDCRYCSKSPCRCFVTLPEPTGKYQIFLTNVGSFLTQQFTELAEAVKVANEKGFEYSVWKDDSLVASGTANGVIFY